MLWVNDEKLKIIFGMVVVSHPFRFWLDVLFLAGVCAFLNARMIWNVFYLISILIVKVNLRDGIWFGW